MAIKRDKVLAAARKHWSKGNWERALREYEKLVEDDPRDVTSLQLIAQAHIRLGRPADGQETYRRLATHHLQDDYYDKAAAFFKMAVDIEGAPRKPELHWSLGESYHKMGRLKEALIELNQANNIYRELGDARAQRAALEYMLRLDPENNNLRIQLAERYVKDGLKDEAIGLFTYAADKFDEEGRLDDYLRVLERLIFLDQSRVDLQLRAAQLHVQQLNFKRALKLLKVLYRDQPEDLEVLRLLSYTFEQLDQRPKAVMVYRALAMIYRRQQDTQRALQTYEHILTLDPSDAEARQIVQRAQQPQRNLEDSGTLTSAQADTGNIARSQPQHNTQPPQPEPDAMADVEFLDDDLGEMFQDLNTGAPATPQPQAEPQRVPEPVGQSLAPSETLDDLGDFGDLGDLDFGKFQALPGMPGQDTLPPEQVVARQNPQPNPWNQQPTTLQQQPEDDIPELEVEELLEIEVEPLPEVEVEAIEYVPQVAEPDLDKAIKHSIEESKVFVKYGLRDKAVASIRDLVANHPESMPARERLRELYLETKQPILAGDQCIEMAKLAHASGDAEGAVALLHEAEGLMQNTDAIYAIAQQLGIDVGGADATREFSSLDIQLDDALGVFSPSDSDPSLHNGELYEITDAEELEDIEYIEVDSEQGLDIATDNIVEELEDGDLLELDDSEMVSLLDVGEIPEDTNIDRVVPAGLPESPTDEHEFAGEFAFSEEDADMMFDNLFGGEPSTPSGIGDNSLTGFSHLDQNQSEVNQALKNASGGQRTLDTGNLRASSPFGDRSLSQRYDYDELDELPDADLAPSTPSLVMVDDSMNTSYELGLTYLQMDLYEEAINEFTQALGDPNVAMNAQYNIAMCEFKLDRADTARQRLTSLKALPGLDERLIKNIERLLAMIG